jgi:hypothetical protein
MKRHSRPKDDLISLDDAIRQLEQWQCLRGQAQ